MNETLKNAFHKIHAEDTLKTDTIMFLHHEIQRRSSVKKRKRLMFKHYTAAFTSVFVVLFSAFFAYTLYFTPSAYVDMDVNPSIELVLNRFNRVIGTYAYNSDGEDILADTDIKHKNYSDAIGILIEAMVADGFTQEDSLISITLLSSSGNSDNVMLSNIESSVLNHHSTAQLDVFTVDRYLRDAAHELNLSPAKYLAIQKLIEVDPTATMDSCREHSIGEIKQLTEEHACHHHNGISDDSFVPDNQDSMNGAHNRNGHH